MTKKVTKRQQAVLDCIESYILEKGYGPSVRDICERLNLSSPSTVHVHLKSLEEKGLIKRDKLKSRSITLPGLSVQHEAEPAFSKVVNLPLVGNVAAGLPILADQNITDNFTLPVDIVGDSASFILAVRGDSMIEAGINDGDYVVVREQSTASNGEIIVAIIEDEATVKRFYKEDGRIRLQPENRTMNPIYTQDCLIAGKVVAVFRHID